MNAEVQSDTLPVRGFFYGSVFPEGVESTPICSYIYISSEHYFGFKFQKNEYIWGYEEIVYIFWGGQYKIGQFWGSFLYILGGGLRSRYRMGIFLGSQNFNIFGLSDIPDLFGVKQ